jgi:hypothetical protein
VTPETDPSFYERAYRRIDRFIWILLAAGSLAALVWRGLPGGLGFLMGAAASALTYRWMKQLVHALGAGAAEEPRRRLILLIGLRYLIFGFGGYVIVKYFRMDLTALLAGLLVSAAAVFGEVIYELIYART